MIELNFSGLTSIIIFIIYILVVLLIMLFISSLFAAVIILAVPILGLILMPEMSVEFLTIEQAEFLNGTVTVNNLHILLFIWTAFLSIIIYTELVSWYISRKTIKKEPEKPKKKFVEPEKKPVEPEVKPNKTEEKPKKKPGQVNIPFKPLERFLQKFEDLISGKK